MSGDTDIASIAAVLADPTRVRILFSLNSEKALPATELARAAGVSRSSASFHLTKLVESGLLTAETCGKYRYFRIANERIVPALEMLATIAPEESVVSLRQSRRADQIRFGRLCQEHMGGFIAVRITDTFLNQGVLSEAPDGYVLTERGCTSLRSVGVEIPVTSGIGSYVPRHPDWSEESHHMAGVVATSLARLLLDRGWIKQVGSSRAVRVTDVGKAAILETFDIDLGSPRR